jgi:predicted permease
MRPEHWIYTIPLRVRSLFRRRRADRELDDELRYHVERKTEENAAKGMTAQEARRAALLEIGGIERRKEECRDTRRVNWLQDAGKDLRYGVRMLRKSPGFTTVAVLTLALGIGANTAIFSALDAVLLKSLPYPDPSRIVLIWGVDPSDHSERDQVSATDVMDWRQQNNVFEDIATYGNWTPTLTGHDEARRVPGMLVGDGYFNIMRAKPILGRTFTPEENIDGKDREVVLSYDFWRVDMGADANVIGKSLVFSGVSHTIVGVLPQSFRSLPVSLLTGPPAQIYRPVGENYDNKDRSARHLRAIARLRSGVTLRQAQTDMSLITERLSRQYPGDNTNYSARVVPMKEDLVGGLRPALLILFGAVAFVLLIACANVANLLLARGAIRQREVAVRSALGASRQRLLRQFFTESTLLALGGGAAGILLGVWGTSWIATLGQPVFPALNGVSVNLSVLLFTLAMALCASLLFGLAPAARAARLDISGALKEGGRSFGAAGHSSLRNLLVVVEIALSMILIAGAGLMIRSVVTLYDLNPGFAPDHLIAMDFGLPSRRYPTPASDLAFNEALLQKVQALPGVESAGTTSVLPLSGNFDGRAIIIYDKPRPEGRRYSVDYYCVSASYFHTMRIALREGRYFTDEDRSADAPVVIIDETMARTIWPGEDPIGKRIKAPGQVELEKEPWSTVIGVVDDVKQWALDRPGTMQLYGDESQVQWGFWTLVARTKTAPETLASPMQSVIRALDPDEAVANVSTMDAIISSSVGLRRLAMLLLASFAGLALLLACVGIYGVMSYSVEQRRQEIGVRLALGAQPRDVLRLALGLGTRLALAGVTIGVVAALALTRLMSSLLFGVSAADPITFAGVASLLLLVALAACYIPARRAMKVDPLVALRYE